jgi:ABC-type sugar transport system ATPase subunit
MASVVLKNIVKRFGRTEVVHGIDLEIGDKEFVVLVGPSGCGKSTVLRLIAGLEEITDGEIWIDDRMVNNVAPKDRKTAMVFQNYALYPHMNVYKNMAFGLTLAKKPQAEIENRVQVAAKMLELQDLLKRKPHQLSGGQRQRVAMGRAIVRNPSVFLFDEPLSNLDAKLRTQMRTEDIIPADGIESPPNRYTVSGVVAVVEPLGSETNIHMDLQGIRVIGKCDGRRPVRVGETLDMALNLGQLHIFDAKTTQSIY